MEKSTLSKVLTESGFFTAKEVQIIAQAATNVAGDHFDLYEQINELVKAKDDLVEYRSKMAELVGVAHSVKKERKPRTPKAVAIPPSDQLASEKKKKRGLGKSLTIEPTIGSEVQGDQGKMLDL